MMSTCHRFIWIESKEVNCFMETTLRIGVQTKGAIDDTNPLIGFQMLKEAGFTSVDFSLNQYLVNKDLYKGRINDFFYKSVEELEEYFTPHKEAAIATGIDIFQMHMPYPLYVPNKSAEVNDFLKNVVAPKSLHVCKFLGCKYIVIHGFKLAYYLGSEELEWQRTEEFIHFLAPMAKEMGITLCIENLYTSVAGHLVEGPCCDVEKVIERLDKINEIYDAEVLGFCFDVGHANIVSLDFEDFITRLGLRLKVLHVHDNDGVADLHQIPFTFTKTRENKPSTDWNGFVRGLRNICYDGAISFETAPVLTAFPDEMEEDVLLLIAKIGKYFVKEIERK